MQNWKTSLFASAAAIAYVVSASPPPFLSPDQQKTAAWLAGAFLIAFGLAAKDGRKIPPAPPTDTTEEKKS